MASPDLNPQINFTNEFYHSTACHICKKITPNIKRCSKCKLYAYCSPDHQKLHWPHHKKFCKMIQELLSTNRQKHHIYDLPGVSKISFEEWCKIRAGMQTIWEKKLGRSLVKCEYQALMLPRICEVCRNSKQDVLFDCPGCWSVSYCSEEHKKEHEESHGRFCASLRLCYEVTLELFEGLKIWEIVFKFPEEATKLPGSMEEFLRDFVDIDRTNDKVDIIASEMLTPGLTILHALEVTKVISPDGCVQKEDLIVHIIGASFHESVFNWSAFRNLFFNWIKNLKTITFVLIGPDVITDFPQKETPSLTVLTSRLLYHNYVTTNFYQKPDVIVAFNCGLHEFENLENDTWKDSLPNLITPGTILAITSYTKDESREDLRRLPVTDNTQVLIESQVNNFSGLRPIRDCGSENAPIFYNNHFISVIKN